MELWSAAQVADHLRLSGAPSARRTLSRWGVKAMGYEIGNSGRPEARFDAQQVREAAEARPKQGARTDLSGKQAHHLDGNPRNNDLANLEIRDTPTTEGDRP